MRKIAILMILAIFLVGCASAPTPPPAGFDPNVNPFLGEWGVPRFVSNTGERFILRYIFTEDQITIHSSGGRILTGTYTFTHNRINFDMGNRNRWTRNYSFNGDKNLKMYTNDRSYQLIISPYFNIPLQFVDENFRNNFTTNQEELLSIQGSWRNPSTNAIYTFKDDAFTLTVGRRVLMGTFIINDNILRIFVNNAPQGHLLYEFKSDNVLFIYTINTNISSSYGEFVRQ